MRHVFFSLVGTKTRFDMFLDIVTSSLADGSGSYVFDGTTSHWQSAEVYIGSSPSTYNGTEITVDASGNDYNGEYIQWSFAEPRACETLTLHMEHPNFMPTSTVVLGRVDEFSPWIFIGGDERTPLDATDVLVIALNSTDEFLQYRVVFQSLRNASSVKIQEIEFVETNRSGQTIDFTLASSTVSIADGTVTLSANATSLLPVTFSVDRPDLVSLSGDTLTLLGAGTVTITAEQGGNGFFLPAPDVSRQLTITKVEQTVTFSLSPTTVVYGSSPITLSASSTSGLDVEFFVDRPDLASISGTTLTILHAGTVVISATQDGDEYYASASPVSQTLTIQKAPQTITFSLGSEIGFSYYPIELDGTTTSSLPITYTVESASGSYIADITDGDLVVFDLGEIIVTASQSGNDDYLPAPNVEQTTTIVKGTNAITFVLDPSTLEFSNDEIILSATVTSGGTITYSVSDTDIVSASGNIITPLRVGSVDITASSSETEFFLAAPDVTRTLTITKISQVLTFTLDEPTVTYTHAPINLSATVDSGFPIDFSISNSSVVALSGSTLTIIGTGTVDVTATQAGTDYYETVSVTRTLTVNKASQSMTFTLSPSTVSYTYGPYTLSASNISGLPITFSIDSRDASVASVSGNTLTILDVGTARVVASQGGDANWLSTSLVRTLTITKASQTITFSITPTTVTYDPLNVLRSFSVSASPSGLAVTVTSSDDSIVSISGTSVRTHRGGTVTLTASQSGNRYFNAATSVVVSYTVNKAPQRIFFAPVPSVLAYDPSNNLYTLSSTATSGLAVTLTSLNPLVAIVSGSTMTLRSTGGTTLSATQSGDDRYLAAEEVTQAIVVSQTTAQLHKVTSPSALCDTQSRDSYGRRHIRISDETDDADTLHYHIGVNGQKILQAKESVTHDSSNGDSTYTISLKTMGADVTASNEVLQLAPAQSTLKGSLRVTNMPEMALVLPSTVSYDTVPPVLTTQSYLGFTFSASSVNSSGSYTTRCPFGAFNTTDASYRWASVASYTSGTYSGVTSTSTTPSAISGEWLQVQFPRTVRLNEITLTSAEDASTPMNWYVLGSVDGSTWVTLSYVSQSVLTPTQSATIADTTAYVYVRIVTTRVSSGTFVAINDVRIDGVVVGDVEQDGSLTVAGRGTFSDTLVVTDGETSLITASASETALEVTDGVLAMTLKNDGIYWGDVFRLRMYNNQLEFQKRTNGVFQTTQVLTGV